MILLTKGAFNRWRRPAKQLVWRFRPRSQSEQKTENSLNIAIPQRDREAPKSESDHR